jgi:hypothetical protein
VSKSVEYQRLAAECLLLAHTASDRTNRVVLLQMAATWLKLAEQALITAAKETETQEPT